MLEKKDIDIIRSIMKEEIAESEKRMGSVIYKRITESENLFIKELDRVQIGLENKINAVQKNLDDLTSITGLQNLKMTIQHYC